jgi:hypothetical protein
MWFRTTASSVVVVCRRNSNQSWRYLYANRKYGQCSRIYRTVHGERKRSFLALRSDSTNEWLRKQVHLCDEIGKSAWVALATLIGPSASSGLWPWKSAYCQQQRIRLGAARGRENSQAYGPCNAILCCSTYYDWNKARLASLRLCWNAHGSRDKCTIWDN